MSIEAMKQALKTLESVDRMPICNDSDILDLSEDIAALRAAIAEASMQRLTDVQQEIAQEVCDPLKPNIDYGQGFLDGMAWHGVPKEGDKMSLPRREWVGLTDEEILPVGTRIGLSMAGIIRFAREIEVKLKEKNT